jgi:dTDP-4-dehydrorhamnose 3,5-epimerase
MNITKTPISDLLIIEPTVYRDDRGYFLESFHEDTFAQCIGNNIKFVQDNESRSAAGVLRGLHFQNPPYAQGKLVRVIQGSALDIAVDIRKESKSYGMHFSIELNLDNMLMLWIPPGFAHGFLALEDNTIFSYKCTNYYNPEAEASLLWNDPDINIDWAIDKPIVSDKDRNASRFSTFVSHF